MPVPADFIYGSEAVLYYAGLLPVSYPVDLSPDFRCADHLHNQIYRVGRDTLRNCMLERYEDCPGGSRLFMHLMPATRC